MGPVAVALGIAKLTGLDKRIGRWIDGDNGEAVAERVTDIAQSLTGAASLKEAMARLERNVDKAHEMAMLLEANEHELEMLAYTDRVDARSMQEAALESDDKFSKRYIYYFATAWSLFSFVYLLLITFLEIPAPNIRFSDTVLGFLLGTAISGMFGFFFGSSMQTHRRSEIDSISYSVANLPANNPQAKKTRVLPGV